ncbi:MAG: dsRBD fold-containing protein [Actinomycetes bacterium]
METSQWNVAIFFEDDGGRTHAKAVLQTRDGASMHGEGRAHQQEWDRDVPEIRQELAASRALHAVAAKLANAATEDVRGTGERV